MLLIKALLVALICVTLPHISRAQLNINPPSASQPSGQGAGRALHSSRLDWDISSKTRDSQVWNAVEVITDLTTGQQQEVPKQFVELGTGMNYQDQKGEWRATREEFRLTRNGFAVAEFGPHMLIVGNNINAEDAIDFLTSDGKRFRSAPLAIAYFDPLTGRNVILATIRDTPGELTGPNVVTFQSAFDGLDASIRITYRKAGMSSDLILHEVPPDPALFGLSPQSHLELYTEFVESPVPAKSERVLREEKNPDLRRALKQPDFTDQILDYGEYKIGTGAAFEINADPNGPKLPVGKRLESIEGRTILIEAVEHREARQLLAGLPVRHDLVRGRQAMMAANRRAPAIESRTFPQRSVATLPQKAIDRAAIDYNPKTAFVLDYSLLTGSTNFTFKCDTTYYVSSDVLLYGTTVLEHAVVKATNWNTYNRIQLKGPVQCLTGPYRPIVFTSMHDNSVGQILPWSTGNPNTNYYGNPALEVDYYTSGQFANLSHIRISYAATGISFFGGTPAGGSHHVLSHAQFMRTFAPLKVYYTDVRARNILVYQADVITGSSDTAVTRFEHLTAHQANALNLNTNATVYLTNSILAHITNSPVYIGSNNATTNSSAFQTVGGGRHYLATNTLRNLGATTINAQLLADLQTMTTYSPIVFSNVTLTAPTTLAPSALRDTDAPDLGYHYAPLDYAFGGSHANTNLTFTAGTAVGWFRTTNGWFHAGHGLRMADRQIVTFEGEVMKPNYWVRCNVAQEGGTGLWDGGFGPGGITSWADQYSYDATRAAEIRGRFTRFSQLPDDGGYPFRDDWGYLNVRLTDCEFWGGGCGGYILSAYLTNCLVERALVGQVAGWPGCEFYLRNMTFKGGVFVVSRTSGPIPVSARDCAFDATTFDVNDAYASNATWTDYDYNAFLTGGPYTAPTGAHDVLVTNFNWRNGPLGPYYLWTNSPPSALINAGSATASTRGLYHYTMALSQVKETNSVVDIGYHYLAVDSYNQPVDTDADLVPDWQEDVNGNGTVDTGEASWTVSTPDNDGDGLSNSQDISLGLNPVRADTDGNGVPDGSEDFDRDSLSNHKELNVHASDPKVKNSKHASVTDGLYFHGAAMGVSGTPAVLGFPSFPGNNVQLTLTGGDGSYDLYFAEHLPNATDEFLWWVYQVGPASRPNPPNDPIVFVQVAPGTPTGFFQAGKSRNANGTINDTDGDGVNDGYEVITLRSIVGALDSDGDGANDNIDAFPLHKEAFLDTDGDFKPDIILPNVGHDPKLPVLVEDHDDDNDGVPDLVEINRGSSSTDSTSLPPMDFYVKITDTTCGVGGQGLGTFDSPFRTIQAAINAAPAPTANLNVYTIIHVATNTYTGAGNYNINFLGKRILLIAERGVDSTVIDCTGAPAPGNGFIFQNGEDEYTRVVGFTVRNAPSSAVACNNLSVPVLVGCVFTNNATGGGNGGGVICSSTASPTFINCKFLKNGTATSLGGAAYVSGTASTPRFTHCTFFDNNRTVSGGQLNFQTGTTGLVNNCIVWTTVGNNTEIALAGTAKAVVMYSDVKQSSGKYSGLLNINADPLLDGNARLTLTTGTTSPCIDVGTTSGPGLSPERSTKTRTDMDNEARTQRFAVPAPATNVIYSASSDIGADEFVYRLILPLDGNGFSIIDEASGVAFLGENGGLSKFAVVDDELDNNVYILHVNNQGLLDTTSPFQNITTVTALKDCEGITFVPTGASAGLYSISSQTKRNRYHTLDWDIRPFLDPPTSDYDQDRTRIFRFGINATFDWNGLAPTLYTSETMGNEASVNYNAANGLITHIRNQFNAAGAPFTVDTTTAPYVMIAFNTCSNFSQPLNGVRYAKGAALPVYGTSLGDSVPANSELGTGAHSHDNTYLPGSLVAGQDYWYRIWSFSQPGAVSTRVYSQRSITVRTRTTQAVPKLYINEVQSNSPDTIELYNPLGVPVDIGLYKLADRGLFNGGQFYSFPTPTVIAARGYHSFAAPFGIDAGSDDLYFTGPDGTPGTAGTITSGTLGTIIDTYINFDDPNNAGTVGRIWDGGALDGQFGVGGEAATSLGAANNAANTKLFDVASAIHPTTPTNYLTYRNIGREPAVWDYSPKQNDLRAINIEGFCYKPAGTTPEEMIIGLRSPLTARTTGNAIYFRAASPVSTFLPAAGGWTGAAAGLNTGLDQLNLNGLGIRGITWYAAQNTYLIVAGTANGGPLEKEVPNERHVLYSWDGNAGTLGTFGRIANPIVIIPDLRPYSARPEGISIITVNGQPRVVFAEDRYRATGYATRNVVHWPVSILGTTFQSQ